jgi:hypothetical protein
MRDAMAAVEIDLAISAGELRLTADIRSTLPLPAKTALNAVIAEEDGGNRYWALAFRTGVPDFHATECRALELAA